jgi:hypothetical protein
VACIIMLGGPCGLHMLGGPVACREGVIIVLFMCEKCLFFTKLSRPTLR